MENSVQTVTRLLAALEDLVAQEAATIRAGDYGSVNVIQDCAAAVVEKICRLATDPAVAALRSRVDALLARRQATRDLLAERLAAGRTEMQRVATARRRLAGITPVYGRNTLGALRLNTAA